MAAMRGRMRKEIAMLETDPPFGASLGQLLFETGRLLPAVSNGRN